MVFYMIDEKYIVKLAKNDQFSINKYISNSMYLTTSKLIFLDITSEDGNLNVLLIIYDDQFGLFWFKMIILTYLYVRIA